jgi:tRNA threonylcarbamoyladenosine biosynthesis protein TsaE
MATSVSIMRPVYQPGGYAKPCAMDGGDTLYDQAGTEALAATLAGRLRPGDAVLLSGPLGAGKSTFARALIRAAAGDPALDVPSPSYTLVQSYATPDLTLHHFDLWRLSGPHGLVELGWEEARADVVIVEWPDRLGEFLPADAIEIAFAAAGERHRRITVGGIALNRVGC